jgi:hypothetical protein
MNKRSKYALGTLVAAGAFAVLSAPAYAHECFNPNKDAHAPTAGVNYTITHFEGAPPELVPIFERTGPGKGIGGFVEIAPGVFGNPDPLYVYSLGNGGSSGNDVVGGPGSAKPEHACDGKGIDYLPACFPE